MSASLLSVALPGPDLQVARGAALVLGLLGALTVLDLTLGTAWRNQRERRRTRQLDETITALLGAVAAGDASHAHEVVRRCPAHVLAEACLRAARSLSGRDLDLVRRAVSPSRVPRRARRDLRSRRWPRRLRGVRLLQVVTDDPPAPERLRDPHPEVRAAAVAWAGRNLADRDPPRTWTAQEPGDVVAALGDALLDGSALVRLAAKHAVATAEPALTEPVVRALERARDHRAHPLQPLAPLAAAAATSVPAARLEPFLYAEHPRVRAAALEAMVASDPSRTVALCAAGVEDAEPVRAAVARVTGRDLDSVHHLVELATDRSWVVRQAARLALHELDAVGRVLARRVQLSAVPAGTEVRRW